jgi:paraquat-inducible protein B
MSMTTEPIAPPLASVAKRGRLSFMWLIPLVTLVVGSWFAWDTISKRGPTITITFEGGEGLQAGQSHIKHKDVDLGLVTGVVLSRDASHVIVTAQMSREAVPFLTEDARFWVVTPRLFAGRISGLDTLISGAYIELLPAAAGAQRSVHSFTGLEVPPVRTSNAPGRTFLLRADRVGSVSVGSPVFFRDLNVGEVLGWDVGSMVKDVTIHAFVRAPFDGYVRDGSRFWNASGVSVKVGGGGVQVQMESIRALLLGGVAFDSTDEAQATPVSAVDREFTLYADHDAALNASYHRRIDVIGYFPGSVAGLEVGSPVTFHGMRLGEVTGTTLEYDAAADMIRTPVRFRVEPGRIANIAGLDRRGPLENAKLLVEHGMRAQIKSTSLVLGQTEIALDYFPDASPATLTEEGGIIVFPTVGGEFADIGRSAGELLSQLNRMPFEQIGEHLNSLLAGASSVTTNPDLKQALQSLAVVMGDAQALLRRVDAGAAPALRRLPEIASNLQLTLANANRLVSSADTGYGDSSKLHRDLDRLLSQFNDMAQSVRVLADLLNRHPEALIRGRTNTGLQ